MQMRNYVKSLISSNKFCSPGSRNGFYSRANKICSLKPMAAVRNLFTIFDFPKSDWKSHNLTHEIIIIKLDSLTHLFIQHELLKSLQSISSSINALISILTVVLYTDKLVYIKIKLLKTKKVCETISNLFFLWIWRFS